MKEVQLNRIKVDENRNEQVIVLKETNGKTLLPVVIGMSEVTAIKFKLSGIEPPRPLTHDLLNNLITTLGAKLKKVIIDKLEDRTFFAKLVIENKEGNEIFIDARPSDSIALALRAEIPIFVDELILEKAGIQP
ncbi:MAG: bifunctional nuclease family protein [Candidatus Omnitrophica bacterium]|nr:bifunctional nuclease family protein [Candidatus Omnitrophota bacterium]